MEELSVRKMARLEEHTLLRIKQKILVGAVAGVWQNGKKIYSMCLGMRDIANGISMTEDTIFRLASMTKPITGTAVLQQAERGRLGLDDEVRRYLPGFSQMQVAVASPEGEILALHPAERPITVRMLLTHSSGLGSGPAGEAQVRKMSRSNFVSLESSVEQYSRFALDFQPGSMQRYSGFVALDVLARLVELTSGLPYAEYLRSNIFDPLEMPDTGYVLADAQAARLMEMYTADGEIRAEPLNLKVGFGGMAPGYPSGGAGLFSTLEDYSHLTQMFLNGGRFRSAQVLSSASVAEMATPQLPENFAGLDRLGNWGLTMRVRPTRRPPQQPLSAGSFGWSGAYGTHFWVDPSKELCAVYLSNLVNGHGASAPTASEFERDVMHAFGECETEGTPTDPWHRASVE